MISIRRQCQLLGVKRSSLYYVPCQESAFNLELMRLIDEEYMKAPFYGRLRMTERLKRIGYEVNHKKVQQLMQKMGLQTVYPKPRTSRPDREHRIYPYLLRGFKIDRPNQVWSADITYVPMQHGFMYLTAVMDWYSRYVIAFEVSNSMDVHFCLRCLDQALRFGTPEVFNTDRGAQFTSNSFTSALESAGIRVSMDSRGRAFDNVFIERLWRIVKQEDIYLKDYATGKELIRGVYSYFGFYNHERVHQSLDYATPADIHFGNLDETRKIVEAAAARSGCHSWHMEGVNQPYFDRSVV